MVGVATPCRCRARRFRGAYVQIDVWTASLDRTEADLTRLSGVLTPEEASRAARFRFPEHQKRFAAARGLLRNILSRYSGVAPQSIELRYGDNGKPAMADRTDLSF